MGRIAWTGLVALVFLGAWAAAPARAEHFAIDLSVEAGGDKTSATADTSPPPQGLRPRPAARARHDEPLVVQFFMTSNFPHGVKKNVTVHFFVARERAVGQSQPPDMEKGLVTDSTWVMDFKPEGRVGLRQRLAIDKAGVYLVRVESANSDNDHEHFAAIDLVVE